MTAADAGPIQAARYGLLSEVVLLIASTPDFPTLLPRFVRQVKWVLDFDRCTLALKNDDAETYRYQTLLETRAVAAPASAEAVPLADGLCGAILRDRRVRLFRGEAGLAELRASFPNDVDPAPCDGTLA